MAVPPNNKKIKALLIESDPQVANTIIEWLTAHADVLVISNESEIEIKEKIQSEKWHLVMTDIDLPSFNDLNVTDFVKSHLPMTPVLILTQDKKVSFILNALQNHADGLLFKPLNKEKFLNLTLRMLETAQAKQQKEGKIILAIGAHPDDVEIGCGGCLAAHQARGNTVNILTLSLGAGGGDPSLRKKKRKKQQKSKKQRFIYAILTIKIFQLEKALLMPSQILSKKFSLPMFIRIQHMITIKIIVIYFMPHLLPADISQIYIVINRLPPQFTFSPTYLLA